LSWPTRALRVGLAVAVAVGVACAEVDPRGVAGSTGVGDTSPGGPASDEDGDAPGESGPGTIDDDDSTAASEGMGDGSSSGDDSEGDSPAPPLVGLWHTEQQLAAMRERAADPPWDAALAAVLAEAEGALSRVPAAVPNFDVPPYYDDPDGHDAAKQALSDDGYAAYALALGYQLASEAEQREAFAAKATEILQAWATINTEVNGDDGDLVMMYKGVHLLYAADLVGNWPGWQPSAFRAWTDTVFRAAAERTRDKDNNHGAWGTFGAVTAAALLEDAAGVAAEVARAQQRIENSIDDNGELPEENKRTNSGIWYTYFALAPLTGTAWVARNVGDVDLFAWVAPNGRTIRLALDRLFYWCLFPERWPYPLPEGVAGELWRLLYPCADELELPTIESWPGNLFEAMSAVYNEPAWANWVAGHRPQRGWHAFVYPTLMRDEP